MLTGLTWRVCVWKLLTVPSHMPVTEHNHHLLTRRRLLHRLTPTPADIAPKLQHSSGSSLVYLFLSLSMDASARPGNVVFMRKQPASWLICTNCPHVGCPNRRCTRGKQAQMKSLQLRLWSSFCSSGKQDRAALGACRPADVTLLFSLEQPNGYFAAVQESIL